MRKILCMPTRGKTYDVDLQGIGWGL